jgi:hypothetical protein
MAIRYTNTSQFMVGTETVSLYVSDSATVASVSNALFGPLSKKQAQQIATLEVESDSVSIKLDKYDLGSTVPKRGSRIDRSDGTKWRVQFIDYSHVIQVYACACTQVTPT